MDPQNELLNEFVQEAKVHINAMEAGLLRMDEGDYAAETINGIFRAVHSIKGTAGFFDLDKVVGLAHAIESLFGALRDQKVSVSPGMIDALLLATDLLKELVSYPAENDNYDINSHVAAVKDFLPEVAPKQEIKSDSAGLSAWDMWDQLTAMEEDKAESKLSKVESAAPLIADESPAALQEVSISPSVPLGTVEHEAERRPDVKNHVVMGETVRVGVDLLNDLLNMVGEMVLRRNQLLRIAQNAGKDVPQLDIIAKGIDNLTTNLQERVMKTRMQPVANVFNKFPRIVRELTRKMNKEVELVMEGINVELDKSIIEALVDPLTHLVRNALDHGIETPETRAKNNKSPIGKVILHAYHESGRVVIDIRDDGGGIDAEKIKNKALQKGITSEKEIAVMRESDIFSFIMRPGFSTAERVTDISGRGVGMDVVKTNIEKLGGKIEIISEVGMGTTFRLILPLTLAIIPSFIVETDGDAFAVPQANVKELVLIQPGEKREKRIEFIQNCPVLKLRNQLLPLIRLGDILDTSERLACEGDNKYNYFADENRTFRILVIKSGSLRYGLVVDAVYDTEEILVKPLPAGLNTYGCYSGVTVLGDGRIAMIIDPESLRAEASLCTVEGTAVQSDVRTAVKSDGGEEQYLLLFKCSGGEMLGLDMAMVSRIEEVDCSRIQRIGSKQYVSIQGQTIMIVRPEKYLSISQKKNNRSKVYVILPKLVKHPIGIIAEEIHDAILTTIRLDANGVCGKGLIGSTLVGDIIVILLNIYELFEEAAPEYYAKISAVKRKAVLKSAVEVPEDQKIRILLAEDTPFFARLAQSYLESAGYEVTLVENGRDALEMINKQTFDMVISDIEMPHMNGIDLVRAIRSSDKLKHLPVIALTSLTSDGDREKGLRAGFDLYEFKIDRVRLLDSVTQMLQKKA